MYTRKRIRKFLKIFHSYNIKYNIDYGVYMRYRENSYKILILCVRDIILLVNKMINKNKNISIAI